jgi:hypothetical protein
MEPQILGIDANREAPRGLNHEGETANAMSRADYLLAAMRRRHTRGATGAAIDADTTIAPWGTGGARRF